MYILHKNKNDIVFRTEGIRWEEISEQAKLIQVKSYFMYRQQLQIC